MSDDGPEPVDRSLRGRSVRVARAVATRWSEHRIPDSAASVAFFAVLSLLPAFLALAAALGPLDTLIGNDLAQRVQEGVLDFLGSVLTAEADGTLEVAQDLFDEKRPGLLTFSLLLAVWTLSRAFAALVRALDVVYEAVERRSWLHLRLTALVLAIGSVLAAAVMLTAIVVGPLFGTGEQIAAEVGLGEQFAFLWNVVRLPVAFVVLVAWAATIFHMAPDHRTPWRWDLPGALLTAVLWLVFSGGLRVYLELAQAGNAVFGALGGALIVLLWFWLLSLAVLLGGELNQVLARELGVRLGSDGVQGGAEVGDEGARVER
jgi:membrane protein